MSNITDNICLKTIFSRKSVRKFNEQAVSEEQLILLVKAGMAAPSAKNQQAWKFIIVTEKELKTTMGEKLPYAKMLGHAPAAIVVCGDLSKTTAAADDSYWVQDCSAATQNILLAAESMGLGAVWTAAFPYQDRVKVVEETLNLPSNLIPLCVIPVGYPEREEKPKDKWKEENLLWNKQS